jgi:hypothetical protein
MPNPVPGDVHVNTPLTNISIAFLQNSQNFIATRVFPNIPVTKQSDRYYTYDRGEFNRDEAEERAPGTESAGGGYTLDNTPTYFARVYAFHKDVPDQVRANSDAVVNPDREATEYVTHKGLIRREKIFAANYFTSSVWTTDITGVSGSPGAGEAQQWNEDASTPIEDVRGGKTVILESTGFEPNTLVLGQKTYDALVDHPDIVDRIKYGQTPGNPAIANIEALMKLFEIQRIFVMKAIENTAVEGATASHSFIGGKHALLCYSAPAPGILTPTAGYTFSWTGFLGAGSEGNRIKRFRLERIESDRVEMQMAFDLKLVSADLGYFWDGIVA